MMRTGLMLVWALTLTACGRQEPTPVVDQSARPAHVDLLTAPSGDMAGALEPALIGTVDNPLAGDPLAIGEGERLYGQMNCAGCHGYGLAGSMGPNLKDAYWRYGGTPVEVFKSIANGHPQGMPAWKEALPARVIWQLVAYIQSKGGMTTPEQYRAEHSAEFQTAAVDARTNPLRAKSGPGQATGSNAGVDIGDRGANSNPSGVTAKSAQSGYP